MFEVNAILILLDAHSQLDITNVSILALTLVATLSNRAPNIVSNWLPVILHPIDGQEDEVLCWLQDPERSEVMAVFKGIGVEYNVTYGVAWQESDHLLESPILSIGGILVIELIFKCGFANLVLVEKLIVPNLLKPCTNLVREGAVPLPVKVVYR